MSKYIALCFFLLLLSCKPDKKQPVIPQSPDKISTSIDGLRTDEVDTLIDVPEKFDTLEMMSNKADSLNKLKK